MTRVKRPCVVASRAGWWSQINDRVTAPEEVDALHAAVRAAGLGWGVVAVSAKRSEGLGALAKLLRKLYSDAQIGAEAGESTKIV